MDWKARGCCQLLIFLDQLQVSAYNKPKSIWIKKTMENFVMGMSNIIYSMQLMITNVVQKFLFQGKLTLWVEKKLLSWLYWNRVNIPSIYHQNRIFLPLDNFEWIQQQVGATHTTSPNYTYVRDASGTACGVLEHSLSVCRSFYQHNNLRCLAVDILWFLTFVQISSCSSSILK